ncbi:MAG TPA: CPBP family intramembrane glutamic endopeptidase [Gammaproteobacteria bacterium]|nr:CPBP family intramembrane glutamic endopeptidase [Gammaproteobacteria bacterium]
MNPIISLIRRYPQTSFWCIACASFFVAAFQGFSGAWAFLIYGSFLGGALVTGIADGRGGLKQYFDRITRWRVGALWYVIALGLPLLLNGLAVAFNIALGAELPGFIRLPSIEDVVIAFFWPGLLGIALAEEPGFRGFALARLLGSHSALKAALIVGGLHTLWHLPLLIQMLQEGYFVGLLTKALIIVSASIFFTWLFVNTRGSVLIAMLLHASEDLFAGDGSTLTLGLLQSGFSAAELVRQDILEAAVFVAMAALIVLFTGGGLGAERPAGLPAQSLL